MRIEINITKQSLQLLDENRVLAEYRVSTAANGAGEQIDSECTPRGQHKIAAKIGADAPVNAVFVGRQPTGELYRPELRTQHPDRDWILTRILWLTGCEPGKNLGNDVDTYNRYIYIHGSPDDVAMGQPGSHGCVRMRNRDVIDLFDRVDIDTPVLITET